MTIYTKSKSQAKVLFEQNGVAAFGTLFSKSTLLDIDQRPHGDGTHQNTINTVAAALPKYLNYIANTKVLAKNPEPEDDSYVVKVLIPTRNGTVNDEPISAGTSVYAAGNSGAVVACPDGKVLELVFTVADPWIPESIVEVEPGDVADLASVKPAPKKPRGKAKAVGDVDVINVSVNTDEASGDTTTPAKIESEDGTDIVTANEAAEEIQADLGEQPPTE